ncbi:MAG: hypothetical protein V2A72_03805 [Candidatus Omnitrophota bacterium]
MTANEAKTDRFKRVAARRTQNVLEAIRKLGNCSNKGIYQYTNDEVTKIFHAVDGELKRIKVFFNAKSNNNTFKF